MRVFARSASDAKGPVAMFLAALDAVTAPTVNRDNNQNSPNENLRLGNYREAIKTMLGILSEPL